MSTNDELIFGIIAPLGVDLGGTYETMRSVLESFNYRVVKISVSEFLQMKSTVLVDDVPKQLDAYIDTMQGAGNRLRHESGRNDALALGAFYEINNDRKKFRASGDQSTRTAYIIRQLKTPAEEKTLRAVYGERFSLVGIFTEPKERERWLAKQIALSKNEGTAWTKYEVDARRLIGLDESEEKLDHGQKVRDTFPLADLFITWRSPDAEYLLTADRSFKAQFDRYVSGLLGKPDVVPTTEEFLMAQARIVAKRSADWSRQVGAVIATRSGSVIAVGRNDDPKVGGGVIASRQPVDSAIEFKRKTVEEVFSTLSDWLKPEQFAKGCATLAEEAVAEHLKSTRLMGLGEFGRMVHAEMAAITDAAARGVAVQGQVIFCTTFPCQNCAKHLMASGIRALVHIEPYPKSLVREMYEDEIIQLPMESLASDAFRKQADVDHPDKFLLLNFMGVAPRSYDRLFTMPVRKDKQGKKISWDPKMARPRLSDEWESKDYFQQELLVSKALDPWIRKAA